MTRHSDHDEIAAHALQVCEDVRDPDIGPQFLYQELAKKCHDDPECMAQVIMCLAAWAPYEEPISSLAARTWAIAEDRIRAWGPGAA